ncbi:TraY domain-containing protein [Providencia rettgeri]|uniref:TraY domain-containing protein n=1 Tax=Providencia rettgeri TaxID=587 RepID=UPI002360C768|nr:TraY domain-containing protein [Providencia rettgeri]
MVKRNEISMKEKEHKSVTITVPISAETNRLLTKSAKRARRSKRVEAVLRLSEHLRLVEHIEGNYQELLIKY